MGHCLEAQNNMMNMAGYLIITNVGMNDSSCLLHVVFRRNCSMYTFYEGKSTRNFKETSAFVHQTSLWMHAIFFVKTY